jgi:hypothetical protein
MGHKVPGCQIKAHADIAWSVDSIEFNAKVDGKGYSMVGVPWADMVSVKCIEARTPQAAPRKSGQVAMIISSKVFRDGKTRTCTLDGKNAQGHNVHNVVVFEKR